MGLGLSIARTILEAHGGSYLHGTERAGARGGDFRLQLVALRYVFAHQRFHNRVSVTLPLAPTSFLVTPFFVI